MKLRILKHTPDIKFTTSMHGCNRRFKLEWLHGREVAVDETMLKFRGRFAGKQYMPKKPIKRGVKCFNLADSSNGYMLNVLPYTGRETLDDASSQYEELPQAARVVLHLAEPYLDQDRHTMYVH